MSAVCRSKVALVLRRLGPILNLKCRRRRVRLFRGGLFFGGWRVLHPVGSAIVRDVGDVDDRGLLNDGLVHIDVGYRAAVHVDNRGVIGKVPAVPRAAGKADAHVATPVVHAAIIADVWSPIAGMPAIMASPKAPVAGGPESASIGSRDPCAGYPVITEETVVPIAGGPDQVRLRAGRLFVDGHRRWRFIDRDFHSSKPKGGLET